MTLRASKPTFNVREKLTELGRRFGLKGSQLAAAETVQEARDFISAGRKNMIINGAMEVAQRGTSSTANGYVSLDRWFVNQSGGSTTFSQETFTAGEERSGLQNYAKFAVSTSSDFTHIRQLIENVKSIPAGSVTVSFDAKGTSPSGGLAVSLGQNFGSGGSTAVDIAPQTVTLTSSWQRFSITFTVPSISGKTVGNSSFFQVVIGQYSDTSTTAWELNITGVQLEVGKNATDFEYRPIGEELALCQRYYYRDPTNWYQSGIIDGNGTIVGVFVRHPVPMRTTPTISHLAISSFYWNPSGSGNTNVTPNGTLSSYSGNAMFGVANRTGCTNLGGASNDQITGQFKTQIEYNSEL